MMSRRQSSALLLLLLSLLLQSLLVMPAAARGLLFDTGRKGDFLPVEEAFKPSSQLQPGRLELHWAVTPGHYLYDRQFKLSWRESDLPAPLFTAMQAGEWHDDPNFGKVKVYRSDVDLVLTAPADLKRSGTAHLSVRYQGCAEAGLCYPPQTWNVDVDLATWTAAPTAADKAVTDKTVTAANPGTSSGAARPDGASAGALADWLAHASFPLVLGAFLLFGLGLSFTPCVLPMLPILSAIIAGSQAGSQGRALDSRRGFLLALSYVLGMSVMYTLAGLLIASLGAAANLSALLQKPAVLITFALVFVALAALLMQGGNLQLPGFLRRPLEAMQTRQQGGAYGSVFVMGAVSSLIVSPCVSAPLAGVMLYLSSTQDAVLGAAALFSLSLGMGLPLLLLGAGGGRLLPRSGPWLDAVKRLFAWLLLAVALSLVNRLLPAGVQMLTWAGLLALTAALLPALSSRRVPAVIAALLLLTWAALLVWGSARGGEDPLRPWQTAVVAAATAGADSTGGSEELFRRITDPAVLDAAVADARRQGKPVIVDVFADWCISCVEMEHKVLNQPDVRAALAKGVRLKFDITATDAAQLDWLQRQRLFGPPAFLAWNSRGEARSPLIGESDKKAFMKFLETAWN